MGKKKLYLKDANVVEQIAKVDTLVFDKTGTITSNKKSTIKYEGIALTEIEEQLVRNVLHGSNHPLSRRLYEYLPIGENKEAQNFKETTGKGIEGTVEGNTVKIGSATFVGQPKDESLKTNVNIAINGEYKGKYVFDNQYRDGLTELFKELSEKYELKILSGDNEGEREALQELLPEGTELIFNQKPEEKLQFIEKLQKQGRDVMMVGDGLNDAGALAQSNVGISISENVNVFSPACDGILDAGEFKNINYFLNFSKNAVKTIKMSFALSLLYNAVGLSFAIAGSLSPLTAAIIMPLSTITIVSFVTVVSNYYASKKK